MRLVPALFLGASLLAAASASAQTLEETLALAMADAPSVAAARAREEAAQAGVSAARAERMPSLTAQGQYGFGRLDPQGYFGLTADNVTPRSAQATIELPIFTGGRVSAGVKQAQGGAGAATQARHGTELDLRVKVVSAYSGLLAARALADSYTRLAAELDEVVRQTQLSFEAGAASSTELAQAKARQAEARAGLAGAQGQADSARAGLAALVGQPIEPNGDLPGLPDMPASRDEAITLAAAHNPQILATRQMVAAARARRSGARAESLPMVGAFAEAAAVRDQFFPGYKADSASVGVRAKWTLFAGGRVAAKQSAADAELRAAQADEESARLGVEAGTAAAFANVESARAMLAAAQSRLAATQEALRGTRLEVQAGAKPPLALLDAEREDINAQAALIDARGRLLVAAYALRAAAGMD
jgi:outer membrane protein